MAISIDQEIKNHGKVYQFIVYTGTQKENLPLSEMSLRAMFSNVAMLDGEIINELPNDEVVVSIDKIEEKFPGTVARLTEIADWLNKRNQNGYKLE